MGDFIAMNLTISRTAAAVSRHLDAADDAFWRCRILQETGRPGLRDLATGLGHTAIAHVLLRCGGRPQAFTRRDSQ
jgi:hypothetical protein